MTSKLKPNLSLKVLLFKKQMSQRQLAFGTEIDESQISMLIRYGIGSPEIRKRVARFLGAEAEEIFPQT